MTFNHAHCSSLRPDGAVAGGARRWWWLLLLLALGTARAADLYVAPQGTPAGPGTLVQPYDLASALSGAVGKAGDTFWLRGGEYRLGHIDTTIRGAPGRPITFRQVAGERARVDGSITVFASIGYVVFRDFELYSSDTNRVSRQTNVGFNPTDITQRSGIASFSPNFQFINLVVHDHVGHGFYISGEAVNNLVYGCVVYNNGWVGPDNASGHNFYVQGRYGAKEIADNLAFNNTGVNFHVYESANGRILFGVRVAGNTAFNAGALSSVRVYRDWVIGVDAPALGADEIVFTDNMGFHPPGSPTRAQVEIGREGINGRVEMSGNYLPLGLSFNNWTTATCSNNLVAPQSTGYIVELNQSRTALAAAWNHNTYLGRAPTGRDFRRDGVAQTFAEWQGASGFDTGSFYTVGNLIGTRVFVRPNRFEAGRAHIVVYNWDKLDWVTVEVGAVLPVGTPYEVRNAQNFFAPPVVSGIFDGQPLRLPMTGLTVAAPNGPLLAPPPTGPTFNVFVLLPLVLRLRVSQANGAVRVSWPAAGGALVLQATETFPATNGWHDVTNPPVVLGNESVVTETPGPRQRFYRLRSR